MKFLMFTKYLQDLNVEAMASTVADLGFDGVDLTTRPGGSVQPERVETDLPEFVRILRGHGLEVGMLTTSITAADTPHAEDIFRTASELGVSYLKLGYYHYGEFGTLAGQIKEIRKRLHGLAALARRYKVTACVHTHSGHSVPPSVELLYLLLQGFDPVEIAAYPDPAHNFVEGGLSGWKMGLDLLSGRIAVVGIKDYGWYHQDDHPDHPYFTQDLGKQGWIPLLVPLTEGVVKWPEVFACLRRSGFDGYLSFHAEYEAVTSGGRLVFKKLSAREVLGQTRLDLAYLKRVIAASTM